LVEIDALHAQPPQRIPAFAPNRLRFKHASRRGHRIVLIPDQSALGEDQRALAWRQFAQQPAYHLFGMAEPVHCGGVYPVHSALQCVTHGRKRSGVVLGSPAECPAATADRPGAKSGSRDHHAFAAKEESGVAVCLLPGTELAFERDVRCNRNWLSTKSAGFRVARFCSFEPDAPHQHHDALSFPDGNTVLVNLLSEGQYARVLQLPVVRREQDVSGEAEKADAAADLRVPA
jgi:hypothetical protein